MNRPDRVILLVLLGVAACTAAPPAPEPVRVEPAWGFNGEETQIDVVGTNFFPPLLGTGADAAFRLHLRGPGTDDVPVPLASLGQRDLNTLAAVVPRDLDPGVYDVEVLAPDGGIGVATDAFTVLDNLIDAVQLTLLDGVTHEVFSPARVEVQLVDPVEAPVPGDLEVEITLTDLEGRPVDGVLAVEGFDTFRAEGDARIVGTLGADGRGVIEPTLRAPGDALLSVRPTADDDRVDGDDVGLTWQRGGELTVEVLLPSDDFAVRAGEPFTAVLRLVDQFGNLAVGAVAPVAITDACNSWGRVADLAPTAEVTVRATAASGTARCLVDRLRATGNGIEGVSPDFRVLPGPVAALEAEVLQASVDAGDEVDLLVRPVDAYGNVTTWAGDVTALDDGAGGVERFSCERGSSYFCSAVVTRAADVVALDVSDGAVSGRSNAFEVLPGPIERLTADAPALVWTAGRAAEVLVGGEDAWGNAVPADAVPEDALTFTGDAGPVDCDALTAGDGLVVCTLTRAGPDTIVLSAPVAAGVVEGQVDVTVVNGELADVDVRPLTTSIEAGAVLPVLLTATDAWGNPWIVRPDGVVWIEPSSDAFPPTSTTLGTDGRGTLAIVPTRSGYTDVVARRLGAEVGRSEPVLVHAGPVTALAVDVRAPWAWVGEATPLRVEARDAYDNRADWTGSANVQATSGKAATEVMLQNGLGEGTITWRAWHQDDVLVALSTEGPTGESAPILAARACDPAASPAIDATFEGADVARACTDASGRARVAAVVVVEPAPGATVLVHGVAVGDAVGFSAAPEVEVDVAAAGAYEARALALQTDGCASEIVSSAWIGAPDGRPVGPLAVRLVDPVLSLDASDHATLARVVDARACDGTIAAGAELLVRADRGRVTDGVPTGHGLRVLTDATGTASFTVDVAGDDAGGQGTVTAWRDDGVAFGTAPLEVRGDHRNPVVREFLVEGSMQPVSTAIVTFSERLDASSVLRSAVELLGEDPPAFTLRTTSGGTALAIDFSPPLEPTPTGWQLTLRPTIRDVAGNPLAGRWEGVADVWSGWFGAPSIVEPVGSCALDAPSFRPDGDPGEGAERETVRLSFTTSALPVWWDLDVSAADGTVVRALQLAPTGVADAWRWDGRDDAGRVVPAGRYSLVVDTKGSRGTRGGACVREVVVDLVEVAP